MNKSNSVVRRCFGRDGHMLHIYRVGCGGTDQYSTQAPERSASAFELGRRPKNGQDANPGSPLQLVEGTWIRLTALTASLCGGFIVEHPTRGAGIDAGSVA